MRIDSLTFFRYIAAVVVVIFHFGRPATGFTGFMVAGPEIVTFFFVLSGFVMVLSHYHDRKLNPYSFWWARVARIAPVYVLAIVILIFFSPGRGQFTAAWIALHASTLQSWFPRHALDINPPAWALAVEGFFYFLFPGLLLILQYGRFSPRRLFALSLGLWLFTQVVLSYLLWPGCYCANLTLQLVNYLPPFHLCSFLLGMAGAYWFMNNLELRWSKLTSVSLLVISATAIVLCLNNRPWIQAFSPWPLAFESSFWGPLFLAFILIVAHLNHAVAEVLCLKPLRILGEASYSIYILQYPLVYVYLKYVVPVFALSPFWNVFAYVGCLTVVSILIFFGFEEPVRRFLRFSLPRHLSSAYKVFYAACAHRE